jgi:hypothetical protein
MSTPVGEPSQGAGHQHQQDTYTCDKCHEQVSAVYDLTPVEVSGVTTYYVCEDCYEEAARELEEDGYTLDLG